jgi:serralysin
MKMHALGATVGALVTGVLVTPALPASAGVGDPSMVQGENGYAAAPIHTGGDSYGGYTPPGVLDGIGAYERDGCTVRVFANHELGWGDGYAYEIGDGAGGSFELTGSRVSYFNVDKSSRAIVDAGFAYDAIYDAEGSRATDLSFLQNGFTGLSRLCSASLFEPHQFGGGRGFEDRIFLTGEEDGGNFNPIGGGEWALDPETGSLWALPDLSRGAWENATVLDTGSRKTVAVALSDDTSPFDADGDGEDEAAPLYLYVGTKDPGGDFAARNGLREGTLHVWVPRRDVTSPAEFSRNGTLVGDWVALDTSPGTPSEDGSSGYDSYGSPTQRNLWTQAEELGAFGFSRPEDVATNPASGNQFVLASTGVDTYVGGADTFGTLYTVKTRFGSMKANVRIIYDGDADPARSLRSPDNLDWADDGRIYVEEDKAEDQSLTGEPLFGAGAANPQEASIVHMDENGHGLTRVGQIDRNVVLDNSIATPTDAVDDLAGEVGGWETSGIVDVSTLFGERAGSLFLFDVQAHGIDDQERFNADSRITDGDLKEGGQLLFLTAP